jgi:hypothetical protein
MIIIMTKTPCHRMQVVYTLVCKYLGGAHTSLVINIPVVTTNSLESIEEVIRIILLLNLQQGIVVATEESVLPVWLTEVGLILVTSTTRSNNLKLRHKLVGHAPLISDHIGPRGSLVPGSTDLHGDSRRTESGEDSVVDIAGVGDVEADTDGNDAVFGDVADGGGDAGWVGVEGVTGDESASVLVFADTEIAVGKGPHVLVVVVVVGVILGVGNSIGDVEIIKDIEERSQEGLDVGAGFVVCSDGVEGEERRGNLIDDSGTSVNHGRKQRVELGNGLIENVWSGTARQELKTSTADSSVRVSLDGGIDDYTIVTGTTAAEGPEEVRVGRAVGSDELSIGSDHLVLQGVIGSETEGGTQSGVTTTLDVTSSETDGGTFTPDNDEILCVSSLHDLVAHDTSANLESGTGVVSVRPVLVLDGVEVVHPDREGTSTSRTSKVTASLVTVVYQEKTVTYSWPVLRMTKRMLFCLANLMAAITSLAEETLTA